MYAAYIVCNRLPHMWKSCIRRIAVAESIVVHQLFEHCFKFRWRRNVRVSDREVKNLIVSVLGFESGTLFKHLFDHFHPFDHFNHLICNWHYILLFRLLS